MPQPKVEGRRRPTIPRDEKICEADVHKVDANRGDAGKLHFPVAGRERAATEKCCSFTQAGFV